MPANVEPERLLTTLAEALAEKGLRWELPAPYRENPPVAIMRKGTKEKGKSMLVATISPTSNSELYPSWIPVIEAWKSQKKKGVKRVDHSKLHEGEVIA